eukprot:TRINITY_DN1351_c2_g1_i3.p1 TRINITY_DN1351_c2_g1~~TRINITY_DN1351_c2_g1_i3.p1  ORF type:complete len:265 (-),score=78.28 TRINITY_DN1351_c2_g1_i3:36-830(-)
MLEDTETVKKTKQHMEQYYKKIHSDQRLLNTLKTEDQPKLRAHSLLRTRQKQEKEVLASTIVKTKETDDTLTTTTTTNVNVQIETTVVEKITPEPSDNEEEEQEHTETEDHIDAAVPYDPSNLSSPSSSSSSAAVFKTDTDSLADSLDSTLTQRDSDSRYLQSQDSISSISSSPLIKGGGKRSKPKLSVTLSSSSVDIGGQETPTRRFYAGPVQPLDHDRRLVAVAALSPRKPHKHRPFNTAEQEWAEQDATVVIDVDTVERTV